MPGNADAIRTAFAAYERGDFEPIADLLAPDVYWRGVTRGHLWWKHTPE